VCVCVCVCGMCRAGHGRICTPYMAVYSVISLPKTLYIYRIYNMVLSKPRCVDVGKPRGSAVSMS